MPPPKKTILFVHHGKGLGGAPLSLLYLIQGLDPNKYQPIVVFLYPSEIIDLYKQNNIQTVGPLNVMDFPHTKIWWLRWYHVGILARVVKDLFRTIFFIAPHTFETIKPDIVHLNTSSLVGWAIAAHKKQIPIAWHIREPLADGYCGLRKTFIKHCVSHYATTILPISHNDARPWTTNKKTVVLHNTVNPARFDAESFRLLDFRETMALEDVAPAKAGVQPARRSHVKAKPGGKESWALNVSLDPGLRRDDRNSRDNPPIILFLGGLSKEKGTHIILDAFTRLKTIIPNAQLMIAGTCNLTLPAPLSIKNIFPATQFKKQIIQQLATLGPSVQLLGPITNVPQLMAASTVIVFPATVGHFARPIIEAGFMRKPVIASALPPLDELVIDGKTGFLVQPNDIDTWAAKLALLIQDQTVNQAMGHEAYHFCNASFNFEQYNKKIDSVYAHILKARGSNETRKS